MEALQAKVKTLEKENQTQQPEPNPVENTTSSFTSEKAVLALMLISLYAP